MIRMPEPIAPVWSLLGHGVAYPTVECVEPYVLAGPRVERCYEDLIPGVLGHVEGFEFIATSLRPAIILDEGLWSFSTVGNAESWS